MPSAYVISGSSCSKTTSSQRWLGLSGASDPLAAASALSWVSHVAHIPFPPCSGCRFGPRCVVLQYVQNLFPRASPTLNLPPCRSQCLLSCEAWLVHGAPESRFAMQHCVN